MEDQEEKEPSSKKHAAIKLFGGLVVGAVFTGVWELGYDWFLERKKTVQEPEEE